jgi:chemotaxis response regulator CheB
MGCVAGSGGITNGADKFEAAARHSVTEGAADSRGATCDRCALCTAWIVANRDIIAIGASAGGLQAILELLAPLPVELPASIFVVVHVS